MENILTTYPRTRLNLVRAKDYIYTDINGDEYIDLESGIWCASLGHSHPKIVKTIHAAADAFIHAETRLKPEFINNIAVKILDKAGIDGKAVFLNTGSEAIDFAITLARIDKKERKIVGFTDNYLGAYGQISEIKNRIDIKKCIKCEKVECKNCPEIKNKISKNCIFIFDPFCFMRQVLEVPAKLIQFLQLELKKKKCILILDEITAGLGRTGKWFGFQHYNLKPDLIVLGKTLGNGYPISAVLMTKKVANQVEKIKLNYAQSHLNDPMGCKIAEAVIDTLEQERLIEQSRDKGKFFLELLNNELRNINEVVEIRGKGMMVAMELNKRINVENVYQRLIRKGIIIGTSSKFNVLNFFPAFTLPEKLFHPISIKIKDAIIEESRLQKELSIEKLKHLSYKY